MAINSTELEAASVQFTEAYQRGLKSVVTPVHSKIATPIKMPSATIKAPIARMVGAAREWIGPRLAEQLGGDVYTITAKKYEKSVEVMQDDFEDDLTGTLAVSFESLGQSAANVADVITCAKLEAGETDLCYDGKAFFASDHPEGSSTYANVSGSGSAPWYVFDISKPLKPMIVGDYKSLLSPPLAHLWDPTDPNVFNLDKFVSGYRCRGVADYGLPQLAYKFKGALSTANFMTVCATMRQRKNSAGDSLGVGEAGFFVLVPPVHAETARTIFGREYLAGGEQNVYNGVPWMVGYRLSNS